MRLSRAVLVLALVPAACRSDGGIDRADRVPELQFAFDKIGRREREGWEATKKTFSGIPDAIARSFDDAEREMAATYYLYLEDHAARPRQASAAAGGSPETYIQQR
jgi:hypothetical protein